KSTGNLDIFKTHFTQPKYQSNPSRPNQHPVFQQVLSASPPMSAHSTAFLNQRKSFYLIF
ncbi:hypothetical protein, partial [Acinetobacter ursingii]|uniref:hypothetical protein n=1 Tax=Acinetobacter ursingii TaxID=108980 RepID=UPI0021CD5705